MDPTTVEKSLSHRFSLRHCVWPSETTVSTDLGKNQPNVCIYAYLYKYVYIYIYIHTQHMYISEYVYSGFNPSQNLKTMSQMELLIPCRIGCASFNSFDQWGAFPIHHRFTYTLIFNEYHSGVTRMISTIVRPNIY